MELQKKILQLTDEDKLRYETQIDLMDLSQKDMILENIPAKLKLMLSREPGDDFQTGLAEDISQLYTILKKLPDLDETLQKRILFALKYFIESRDEIPDDLPDIGYLDDAVVVRWVVDRIMLDYSEYFDA